MCEREGIDGIIASHLDPCQRPYYELCHRMGLPCYIDTLDQLESLTDKNKFKELCVRSGVDIIETFDESHREHITYPVLVKPSRNRGSRGQSVCNDYNELQKALRVAKLAS